jgi:hypothetical protein
MAPPSDVSISCLSDFLAALASPEVQRGGFLFLVLLLLGFLR